MSLDNDTEQAWQRYEQQNARVNPRTTPAAAVRRPNGQLPRPAAPFTPPAAAPAAPQKSRHDQLLDRARQIPKLAKLAERHDKILEQIEEQLEAAERAEKEKRQREIALEQAREAKAKLRADLEKVQATLAELQPSKKSGKRQYNLSDEERERRRQQAYKMQAAKKAKREAEQKATA